MKQRYQKKGLSFLIQSGFNKQILFLAALCFIWVPLVASSFAPDICQNSISINRDWSDEVIYFILIDRFNNGDPKNDLKVDSSNPFSFHGGDIPGIIKKLDYLQDLGITALWISPVFQNRPDPFYTFSAYHGYWVWDFFNIDRRFGTLPELKQLSDELHRRGMRLILDFVVNHMDYDAPFVKKFPSWFHRSGNIEDWNNPIQLENFNVFGLPDFASEKPVVQNFFQAIAKHWIKEIHPDGFRLDAVKHVPLAFWKNFNTSIHMKNGKGFLLLGELLNGDESTVSEVQEKGGFDSLFDFPLYYTLLNVFAKGGSARQLGLRLFNDYKYSNPNNLATLLDNHDVERFITSCKGDLKKYKQAIGFILTSRGIPTLYYGDEVALPGGEEPYNRGDMNFLLNPQFRNFVKSLIKARKTSPALNKGLQMQLYMDAKAYAFCRFTPNDQAISVFNLATYTRLLKVPLWVPIENGETFSDFEEQRKARVRNGNLCFLAPPVSFSLFFPPKKTKPYSDLYFDTLSWKTDPNALGTVDVTFNLNSSYSSATGTFYLIGSLPQIGAWKLNSAVPLAECQNNGIFSTTIKLPSKAIFEFKFISKNKENFTWQNGENFLKELPPSGTIILSQTWDNNEIEKPSD